MAATPLLNFRLDPEVRARLHEAATASGETVTAVLRSAIVRELEARGIPADSAKGAPA